MTARDSNGRQDNSAGSGGLLATLKSALGPDEQFPPARLVGDDYSNAVEALTRLENSPYTLLAVRPPLESDGIKAAARLYQGNAFHDVRLGFLKRQQSPRFAHEMRYEDGKITFYYGTENPQKADAITSKIRADYKDVDVNRASTSFPTFQEGDYVSAARIHLAKPFYYPIKSPLTEKGDPDPVTEVDPYRDLLTDMVVEQDQLQDGTPISTNDCRVLVQAICQPARDVWSKRSRFGVDVQEIARQTKKGELKTYWMGEDTVQRADATDTDKKAAKIIDNQQGQKGYYVTMRVVAISRYPELAQRRVRQVANDYSKYYESFTQQSLKAESVPADEVPSVLLHAIARYQKIRTRDRLTQLNQTKFLLTRWGLASVCHLPTEEVNVPEVDFATMETGPGVPADAPQMEDLEHDRDTESTSRTRTINAGGPSPDRDDRGRTPPETGSTPETAAGRDHESDTDDASDGEPELFDADPASDTDATDPTTASTPSESTTDDSPTAMATEPEPESEPEPEAAGPSAAAGSEPDSERERDDAEAADDAGTGRRGGSGDLGAYNDGRGVVEQESHGGLLAAVKRLFGGR